MKKITALLLALLLLLLTGCGSGDSAYDETYDEMNPTPPPTENSSETTELTGTLTLSSAYPKENSVIGFYGELFQNKHPGVEVIFDMPDAGNSAEELKANIVAQRDKLLLNFYSDSGGDVYDMYGLDYQKVSRNGLMKDLYYYMDKDDSFNMDNYYKNIWESTEVDGKLFALTTHFSYDLLQLNLTVCDELDYDPALGDSIDYKQLESLFKEGKDKGLLAEDAMLLVEGYYPYNIDAIEFPGTFVDIESMTANFENEAFIDYYNDLREDDTFNPISGQLLNGTLDENYFACFAASRIPKNSMGGMATEDIAALNKTLPVKLNASNGNVVFDANRTLSISALSDTEMLPWEFVKFVLADRDYSDTDTLSRTSFMFDRVFEVNRNNHKKAMTIIADENAAEFTDKINLSLNTPAVSSTAPYMEYLKSMDFSYSYLNAEEAARILQEKADLYFSEW